MIIADMEVNLTQEAYTTSFTNPRNIGFVMSLQSSLTIRISTVWYLSVTVPSVDQNGSMFTTCPTRLC